MISLIAIAFPLLLLIINAIDGHAFTLNSVVSSSPLSARHHHGSSVLCQTTTTSATTTTTILPELKLTSPPMKVYIEDTDAYGVVYNTNYIRAYERALHGFGSIALSPEGMPMSNELLLQQQDWYTVKVEKQRFQKSHALGGDFVVTGTRRSSSICDYSSPTRQEVWDLEMTDEECGTIYNSATLTIGTDLPSPPPLRLDGTILPTTTDHFVLYRDEFDINLPGRLPLRNVMNQFERARSNGLGGPDSLRRLQHDDGLIFVVTNIEEAALIHNDAVVCQPGMQVTVTTAIQVKRRGMMRFLHTMWAADTVGTLQRVAQAVVVLMTLDAETRKPTSALPDWLKDRLTQMASGSSL